MKKIWCQFVFTGYTFNHGSFLKVTSSGVVVLEDVLSTQFSQNGERKLNLRSHPSSYHLISPGVQEMFRDVIGKWTGN